MIALLHKRKRWKGGRGTFALLYAGSTTETVIPNEMINF